MYKQNVKIPYSLLTEIIGLLEVWEDIRYYDWAIQLNYDAILFALIEKKQGADLRQAYARVRYAKNNDDRHDARIACLKQKSIKFDSEPF